ncbi:hypothetical protein [Streptomyces sp. NPDC056255]|uniref:hypothetical protein n=1 Tax=Streptomyces sp. NPDC056255 TaxID=3345764 RepID=UPI0035D54A64
MLLAAQPDMPADKIDHEAVPLTAVMRRLDVSQTTASDLRRDATALQLSGYWRQDAAADAAQFWVQRGEGHEPHPLAILHACGVSDRTADVRDH